MDPDGAQLRTRSARVSLLKTDHLKTVRTASLFSSLTKRGSKYAGFANWHVRGIPYLDLVTD